MEREVDFLKRDGRAAASKEPGLRFLLSRLGFAAISLSLGVPIALLTVLLRFAKASVTTPARKTLFHYPPISPCLVPNLAPLEQREFDVILFGATGFTGEYAAKHLFKEYSNTKVRFALAGRNASALERVKQRCLAECGDDAGKREITLISNVDSFDEEALQQMCARTRVVLSTVGPFVRYGTTLVRSCISTRTSYCDITGETDWYAGLVEAYDSAARAAGSRIVSFCGHDCVPWDLLAYKLAQRLGQEKMVQIHMEDEAQSAPSGGTVATIMEAITARVPKSKLGFSPLLIDDAQQHSAYDTRDACSVFPVHNGSHWGGPFVMAMVNAQVVRRSNALNAYGPPARLRYSEVQLAPSFLVLLGRYFELVGAAPLLFFPNFLQRHLLPQPGSGPSQAFLDTGFLQITAHALGERGTRVSARIYFDHDMGYVGTGRLLVEAGLSMALNPEKCLRAGGVLTPATCMPDVLLDRLLASKGTEFCYLPAQ